VPDTATSTSPAVQAQLDRLAALSPGRDLLGLERIGALCRRLGNPERRLPPVFHVAGTNGKGSTCAVLRAAIEAAGLRAHVYASPHLVRFNERIRLAGTLIEDDALACYLARVLDIADGIAPSFFEVTTAAAFLAFADKPADACIVEVGLGGRLDATNVIPDPAACGIAGLGIDHQAFLGDDPAGIAREKAGIAKPGRPLVTLAYPPDIAAAVAATAKAAGAPLHAAGRDWHWQAGPDGLTLALPARRHCDAAAPALAGPHQAANAALALAMLAAQDRIALPDAALAAAPRRARWPARLQRLSPGPLVAPLGDRPVILDGGHNLLAAATLARHFAATPADAPATLIVGMLANKDAAGFVAALAAPGRALIGVPTPGHEHHAPETLAALAEQSGMAGIAAADLPAAIRAAARLPGPVLITGSLYLAGEVLRRNDELPG
jgi:dihydrofolate synthase/folylpolyglutamate synthase